MDVGEENTSNNLHDDSTTSVPNQLPADDNNNISINDDDNFVKEEEDKQSSVTVPELNDPETSLTAAETTAKVTVTETEDVIVDGRNSEAVLEDENPSADVAGGGELDSAEVDGLNAVEEDERKNGEEDGSFKVVDEIGEGEELGTDVKSGDGVEAVEGDGGVKEGEDDGEGVDAERIVGDEEGRKMIGDGKPVGVTEIEEEEVNAGKNVGDEEVVKMEDDEDKKIGVIEGEEEEVNAGKVVGDEEGRKMDDGEDKAIGVTEIDEEKEVNAGKIVGEEEGGKMDDDEDKTVIGTEIDEEVNAGKVVGDEEGGKMDDDEDKTVIGTESDEEVNAGKVVGEEEGGKMDDNEDKSIGVTEIDKEVDAGKLVGDEEEGKMDVDEDKPVGVTEIDEEEEEEEPMEADENKSVDEDMESEEEAGAGDEEKAGAGSPEQPIKTRGGRGRKRRRGGKTAQVTPKATVGGGKTVEEEDVCFVCFDGGDLVLCDKRDCPKAYHPSCIEREEAFFQTKGRWNCGWHLCNCSKKAEYMCYTCTFSLCKSCMKKDVLFCVKEKEKKGFCDSCVDTLMLIENGSQDFSENSWEYLFRDYWTDLKAKLNVSLSELVEAKNAWKESNPDGKEELPARHSDGNSGSENASENPESQPRKTRRRKSKKPKTHGSTASASDGDSGSENPSENLDSQTRKTRGRKPKKPKTHGSAAYASDGDSESEKSSENLETQTRKTRGRKSKKPKTSGSAASASDGTRWASKELLEFVAHMGKDTSYQSQFDVQALLLEYIKTNNLRDSRRKSQIICDARLQRLFGKQRVGHFEMLKLLESHFFIKEDDDNQGSVVDTEFSPVDDEKTKDKKRKHRKKGDQAPQSNREDYAAIDVHNINLIYLRRKLADDLLDDTESFHSKVVGTFVRIRISGANHNQDMYRLVQVTGTTTAGASYVVGKKSTDIMLEILNLDKTESVSINTISNQEFTEDECKRLRQSIKCGLINRLTVGDILDKAIELQPARVNDWIETEIVRLSHLRDRASDLGRKKELRECVEKLEVLKKPEERARRLQDIPVIHDDPTMDPNYESEDDTNEDDKKHDMYNSFDPRSSKRRDYPSKESWRGTSTSRSPGKSYEFSRSLSSNNYSKEVEDAATSPRMGLHNDNIRDQGRDRAAQQPPPPPPSVLKKPSSAIETEKTVGSPKDGASETEKTWHYKDPTGKIQGPFSMAQLRKWNNNKFFPADLRIWRTSEKESDSILLTDALEGRFTVKTDRPGLANLPSPTPNKSLGPVGPNTYQEGPQPPTPNGSQLAASLVTGGNMQPNAMVQPLPGQNAYGWNGDPFQNQQANQWPVQNPAGNFMQQQPPQPNVSWPTVPPNPNVGLVGPTPVNQPMNWGAVNVNPPWGMQAGPGNMNPGWVPPQPVPGVAPNQVWFGGPGPGVPPTQGWFGGPVPVPGPSPIQVPVPIVSGNGNPVEVPPAGNPNQGWGSPMARSGGEPYNRSGGGSSGFSGNRRNWEKQGSFNNRGR